jgi:hypothetical protein
LIGLYFSFYSTFKQIQPKRKPVFSTLNSSCIIFYTGASAR